MLPNVVITIAVVLRLVWAAWVLYIWGKQIGKPATRHITVTKGEYAFICFLALLNLIICGRALGWW